MDRTGGRPRRQDGKQRFRTPRDLWLAAAAVPLAATAQRAREVPLPELVEILARRPGPSSPEAPRVLAAASRAVRLWSAVAGSLDSCLVRSLVAGRMLAPHHAVRLVLGFRPTETAGAADGHAWLDVDGEPLQVTAPPDGSGYREAAAIPFPAPSRGGER